MEIPVGTRLGPYEVRSTIGAGGMGEVYRARDTRLGRDVAIKILPQRLSANVQLKERFEREARAISSLNHARICTLHDVGNQDGLDFLVMEYLEGESLAERLRRGPLPLKETLKTGTEVCEALEVAHRHGIIHRDLKPGNIMLTKGGVKLMDFGLAKVGLSGTSGVDVNAPLLSAAQTFGEGDTISPLTTDGQVLGTIQYMSPEQIEGKQADERSDIFALGAILYEMATGKRPFEGKSQLSVASAILEKNPEPISSLRKELTPPEFERIVNACLAKNPDDRFQSARDVRLQLQWTADLPSQIAQAGRSAPAPSLAIRVAPWAIAALLAFALAGLFFLGGRHKPEPQYTMVTFREGTLEAARFSHDGQTIVYSGVWEGQPQQVYTYRVGRPESRELGIPSASLASVSASDELAVFHDCELVFVLDCGGTLATVSLGGGSPRDMTGHVAYADWNPDGKQLVLSRVSAEGALLEFPLGHLLYQQKTGWLGHPRFSTDGKTIAFENHPSPADEGTVDVVDVSGNHKVLSKGWVSIEGLAWSPNGTEVWFASNSRHSGWADTIRAVTPSGKERVILTLPSVRLHDIASDGRVLLSRENWRGQLRGYFPGDKDEHPYSWMDASNPSGISTDGRIISFVETGELWSIAGESQAYFRSTDGSPPVSIGAGTAVVSPDGKWIATSSRASHKLVLQPVGLGEPRELPTTGLAEFEHLSWSDDGRFVAYEGKTTQNEWNAYVQPAAGGPPKLVQPGARNSYPKISPNGGMVALKKDRGGINLSRLDESPPTAVHGVMESEYPIRFADEGRSLLVADPSEGKLGLTLVELASGKRTYWKRFNIHLTGFGESAVVTPDLKYYAYLDSRMASILYVVDNLR